jgi:hypothetical protein
LHRSIHEGYPETTGEQFRLVWRLHSMRHRPKDWRPFSGDVSERGFSVRRLSTNTLRPVAKARLSPGETGTEVSLTIAPGAAAQLGVVISCGLWLFFTGLLLANLRSDTPPEPTLLLALAVVAAATGLVLAGPLLLLTVLGARSAFKEDEPILLDFLRSTLDLEEAAGRGSADEGHAANGLPGKRSRT